jgi:hypothetical protein
MDFHTFPKPTERTLKAVVKGLPIGITEAALSEELTSLGYEVAQVRQCIKEGRKLRLRMFTLNNSPASNTIFNEHSFFFIFVKIEPYSSTNPVQCFNCQRIGH